MPSDIYATMYALVTLELLGEAFPNDVLRTALIPWLQEQRAASGWFYRVGWADTIEARKLESEFTLQTLCALLVLQLHEALSAEELVTTRDALLVTISSLRYMGTLCHVLRSLSILNNDPRIPSVAAESARTFVERHFDLSSGGFFEYLFEEAKVDEIAGQVQRYQHDYLAPTITAAYHALWVLRMLQQQGAEGPASPWWTVHHDQIQAYFDRLEPQADGGFGSRLRIAKLTTPFGPDVTPLESLMVICAPALLEALG